MDKKELANQIFLNWKVSLVVKSKKDSSVSGLFDDLFQMLRDIQLDRDEVRPYVDQAIKTLLPSKVTVKQVYKRSTYSNILTEVEFADSWNQRINDKANESYLSFFPSNLPTEKVIDLRGMSKEDYRAYRQYADAFPEFKPE